MVNKFVGNKNIAWFFNDNDLLIEVVIYHYYKTILRWLRAYKESPVFSYLERARSHYSDLGIPEKDDGCFFTQIGLSKKTYKEWYKTGIKPIYNKVLDLFDELKQVKADRDRLECQLNELLSHEKN